jgi:hypothetical protein
MTATASGTVRLLLLRLLFRGLVGGAAVLYHLRLRGAARCPLLGSLLTRTARHP